MNQILFGGALIDVEEIESTANVDRPLPNTTTTMIRFRNGHTLTLRLGDKAAFDAWAKGRKREKAIPCCQTCVYHDWKIGPCQSPVGREAFPDCYKAHEDEEPVEATQQHSHPHKHESVDGTSVHKHDVRREAAHPLCKVCRTYHDQGTYGWCKGDSRPYPECHKPRRRCGSYYPISYGVADQEA